MKQRENGKPQNISGTVATLLLYVMVVAAAFLGLHNAASLASADAGEASGMPDEADVKDAISSPERDVFFSWGGGKEDIVLSDSPTSLEEPDTTPPVLNVPDTIEILIGDPVSYKSGVILSDDTDEAPVLDVDISWVRTDAEGVYPVFYTASDSAGNESIAVSALVVRAKDFAVLEEEVDTYVKAAVKEIITPGMTDEQKAKAVFDYAKNRIAYAPKSAERDLISAGYVAFTKHAGDCYINFACSKLLLDEIGIPNIEVERLTTSKTQSNHYWLLVNTGSGWYHFDPSPHAVSDPFDAFMRTDAEIRAYARNLSDGRTWYYNFDEELYTAYPRELTSFPR